MRLIFMTSSSSLSGGTRQAMYLAQGLMARGHELDFFVPHDAEITGLDRSVNWRRLPEDSGAWRGAVQAALPAPGEPCVVHAFHNKANKRLAWWGLSWRRRGAVCLGYRGVIYRPHNPLPYWSPGIDCFTVNSRACARVLRSVGLPARRTAVVPNGIPRERVTPHESRDAMRAALGIQPGELVFGTVAGDKPVKGVGPLLKGFSLAVAEGMAARLVLVGARPERWAEEAEALGVADRAVFTGRVENVADHLQVMDGFILPSLSESMPGALLEALFFGLPAIGSDVGGVPELIDDNGILVPKNDPEALARAMRKLAADPELRRVFGRAGKAKAGEFTLEAKLARSVEVYNEVLARRGLRAEV